LWLLPELPTVPPKGPAIDALFNFSAAAGATGSTSQGPTIDIFFNFGGDYYRSYL
jgi:hypothetical protein